MIPRFKTSETSRAFYERTNYGANVETVECDGYLSNLITDLYQTIFEKGYSGPCVVRIHSFSPDRLFPSILLVFSDIRVDTDIVGSSTINYRLVRMTVIGCNNIGLFLYPKQIGTVDFYIVDDKFLAMNKGNFFSPEVSNAKSETGPVPIDLFRALTDAIYNGVMIYGD